MYKKIDIAVLGATGMVGQRFVTLLDSHPYFNVKILAASPKSSGKTYEDAVNGRWKLETDMPFYAREMIVENVWDINKIASSVSLVLCALDLDKASIIKIEEDYAKQDVVVISNNSANRLTSDVPMMIPEINGSHLDVLKYQMDRLGGKGFIVTKPNCSIQSYVPALEPLKKFGLESVVVSTYQAISGSGRTFNEAPEILDNIIPFIPGEEEKSEKEPLKIWGEVKNGMIIPAKVPIISASCIRVPVLDGHTATVAVKFKHKPSINEILDCWDNYKSDLDDYNLPSAPKKFIRYFNEENRPQPKIDRLTDKGMSIQIGRLRKDNVFDYKFICLSHNTIRGAAGGAILLAELIFVKYFI